MGEAEGGARGAAAITVWSGAVRWCCVWMCCGKMRLFDRSKCVIGLVVWRALVEGVVLGGDVSGGLLGRGRVDGVLGVWGGDVRERVRWVGNRGGKGVCLCGCVGVWC